MGAKRMTGRATYWQCGKRREPVCCTPLTMHLRRQGWGGGEAATGAQTSLDQLVCSTTSAVALVTETEEEWSVWEGPLRILAGPNCPRWHSAESAGSKLT